MQHMPNTSSYCLALLQIIPALDRVLSLVGADVRAWFGAMPRPTRLLPHKRPAAALALPAPARNQQQQQPQQLQLQAGGAAGTIDHYYLSRHCAVCDGLTRANEPLCVRCQAEPHLTAALLSSRVAKLQRQHLHLVRLCLHCGGGGGMLPGWGGGAGGVVCQSIECGVYYERLKVAGEAAALGALAAAGLGALCGADGGDAW